MHTEYLSWWSGYNGGAYQRRGFSEPIFDRAPQHYARSSDAPYGCPRARNPRGVCVSKEHLGAES